MAEATTRTTGPTWRELSLAFTDDAGIRIVNEQFLGQTDVTDVIAFHYDPIPGEDDMHTGEIVVNVERAVGYAAKGTPGDSARSKAHRESRELALYLAHGCDHLAGEDDHDRRGRERMRRREKRWLKKADRFNLIDGLLRLTDDR